MNEPSFALGCLLPLVAFAVGLSGFTPVAAQTILGGSSSARVVYDGTAGGVQGATALTVDVFWCSGDENSLGRALAASELAASYRTLTAVDAGLPKLQPTIIRTRAIDKDVFFGKLAGMDATLSADNVLVRYDPKDEASKLFADRIVGAASHHGSATPVTFSAAPGSTSAPNYLSIFVCMNLDAAAIGGRLFFQVRNQEQTDEAFRAAADVRKVLPGLLVVKDIEIVGVKAPAMSELRYFFDDDATVASRVAATISSSIASKVVPKRVSGYESRVRKGTLEAWIVE